MSIYSGNPIMREGSRMCEEVEKELALLLDMARTQEQRDFATRKEG
jgi:hypothetical protein